MVVNFPCKIIFAAIILFIGFHNVAIADQNIYFNLSPSDIYLYETTTFNIEFTSSQNLSNLRMHFYVDNEKIGTKTISSIEKNKKNSIKFDYFPNKNSYLGEHYIELKLDYSGLNQEKNTEILYSIVNFKKPPLFRDPFSLLFLGIFVIVLISSYIHFNIANNSIIEFSRDDRNLIFGFIITMLPISISLFSLYFSVKPELKIGMFFILIDFVISFIFALFMFIIAQRWSDTDADHFAFYSICFLLLGLIKMVLLVFVF